mgnify:CR=1 FL=1
MRASICFSTTNKSISKIIRWFTNANVSHVYLKFYDQTLGTNLIIHSDYGGVQIDLLDKFIINNFTVEEYEINDPRLDEATKKNLWHLGKYYSYKKLINWAWLIIFKRWIVRKVKEPVKNPKSFICVDYLLYLLNDSKIIYLPIGYFTPHNFLIWCQNNYEKLNWTRHIFDVKPMWLETK